ncbi:alpha/beta hydrolase [Streptomyces dangxiongensis]|uniref:Alpha/beta hydrolase n=1 Tax=Streptomyces dangxiongensis TaxID=1442032 RepID=A0A3G2JDS3_9ACTN|nr:alpha/beta hydrolase [Streptomyces dangxiongensis]AYN40334.1 alpha/beta hydrolase [Streptomyces dangxiongensis]
MRLHTRRWGAGARTAVLVHGIMADHRTWDPLVPVLTGHGYRVVAVDLRGHGRSPRGSYSPEDFADDLVDTLDAGPELMLGHSLGALALALAVGRLRPGRAVYSEPAWRLGGPDGTLDPAAFAAFKRVPRLLMNTFRPEWDEDRVAAELAALTAWDESSAHALSAYRRVDHTPDRPLVPSLVQAADPSSLISPPHRRELRDRGFAVRTLPDVGHSPHRDHFDAFVESLEGWL